jgi:hypothetical protein
VSGWTPLTSAKKMAARAAVTGAVGEGR